MGTSQHCKRSNVNVDNVYVDVDSADVDVDYHTLSFYFVSNVWLNKQTEAVKYEWKINLLQVPVLFGLKLLFENEFGLNYIHLGISVEKFTDTLNIRQRRKLG